MSYFNTYLLESKELSAYQSSQFWKLVDQATHVFGVGAHTPQAMADNVASAWNALHGRLQFSNEGSVLGLGGLMRAKHAAALLKDRGHEIRAQRALQMPQGSSLPFPPTRTDANRASRIQPEKMLTRDEVEGQSDRDCRLWLQAAGLVAYTGNLQQKRKRLLDHLIKCLSVTG